MLCIVKFGNFTEMDILCLVFSDLIVWFEKFVLDSELDYLEKWMNFNIFYLELKWNAALDMISGVEYFDLIVGLSDFDQISRLTDQRR